MLKPNRWSSLGYKLPTSWSRSCTDLQFTRTASNNVNKFTERTHNCGELTTDDIGKRVSLFGWVKYTRFNNKIIALRDSYGSIQCINSNDQLTRALRKTGIHNESVLRVTGLVQARPANQNNHDLATGSIEVLSDSVTVLSNASKNLPILTRDNDSEHTLVNKLKYRYLDLRGTKMQESLRFRSKVYEILRCKLSELNFIECETPTLFRRTPGGANEFIVPTKMKDMFYSLTQSPQQLKQLLMIGGLDRYYQICRCYRDESGRTDRQPEFTQLDIELSFTNQEMIISMINELLHSLFTRLKENGHLQVDLQQLFDDENSIKRVDYHEALKLYGCDKPDNRFGWLIEDHEDNSIGMSVPFDIEEKTILKGLHMIKKEKKLDTSLFKIHTEHDKALETTKISIKDHSDVARQVLGQLRIYIAAELDLQGKQVYSSPFKLIWVTGFPLFEYNEETQSLQSSHHPFTAPTEATSHLLTTKPSEVIGQHYDLVMNGQEIAGGSMRIHDADLQRQIFRDILKLDDSTFDYFTEALKSGCPPHGGIAFGLDRLIALLLKRDSIRDAIAFPKSNVGRDLMSGCPHELDDNTKKVYNI